MPKRQKSAQNPRSTRGKREPEGARLSSARRRSTGLHAKKKANPQGVVIVNMMPKSLSFETQQDSEPTLAVNPANPRQIAGSAFTPDPGGGNLAPIYVS